jgi:hypothetical protein
MLALLALALSAPADAVPSPSAVTVLPQQVTLDGPFDVRQLIVTGDYGNNRVGDLTLNSTVTAEPAGIVSVSDSLFVRGVLDGSAVVTITSGGKSVTVPVTVKNVRASTPPQFRRDIVAVTNVGGCNMGACHGTPSGKAGFKLSLRGFDPPADYLQLTRDQFGRRGDSHSPDQSLTFLKATGRTAHEGGVRFSADSLPGELLSAWLAAGMPDDATGAATPKSVTVSPGPRTLYAPHAKQQLAVVATFTDGSQRDVTRLTNFSSSDPSIADVNLNGQVEFKRPGDVAILCRYLEELVPVRLTYLEPKANFNWPNPPIANYVDTNVYAKLKQMTILPSDECTQPEFVRRAYLDAIGRLPTTFEAKAFLADGRLDKRERLIQELLNKPEFADFWALKWADVLRSSRRTVQVKGTFAIQKWLRDRINANEPFDQTVRELITATGNTFEHAPANYFRIAKDPYALAESTAQLFLGVRMQCAKCHNHPFERWTQDDYYGFATWFASVKTKPAGGKPNADEIVYVGRTGSVTQPRTGKVMTPRIPGGGETPVPPGDPRPALANWLTAAKNPFFAKSVVNRVWFHVMGKGIVDPVDDFRDSNPASNDALLEALANDFATNGYDLKRLVATIMNSQTYRRSATPTESNAADDKYFSHAVTKLLPAEPLLDAICDVTGVPEKFAGLPAGTRAVQLPDGEMNHPFLKSFGQPARELACECERESDGNLGQALQLINGPTVNEKVRAPGNRLRSLLWSAKSDREKLTELYFVALSRPPSEEEFGIALGHVNKNKDKRKGWEDVLWAVMNTREFLFRH